MDNTCAVTTTENKVSVTPFSFDFGSEFIKENLPTEKRTELAVITQNRRIERVSGI